VRAAPIAPALIFATRSAFMVRAVSPRKRTTEPIAAGPLTGRATDFGHNRVTVRFIRLLTDEE